MPTQSGAAERKPSHRLHHVSGEGETAYWTAIGAAWPNKDGKGFNLVLDAIPLTGRVVMRVIPERAEAEESDS